jgi:hypothetical protein
MELGTIPASIGVKNYNPKSKDVVLNDYLAQRPAQLTSLQSTSQMAVCKW